MESKTAKKLELKKRALRYRALHGVMPSRDLAFSCLIEIMPVHAWYKYWWGEDDKIGLLYQLVYSDNCFSRAESIKADILKRYLLHEINLGLSLPESVNTSTGNEQVINAQDFDFSTLFNNDDL